MDKKALPFGLLFEEPAQVPNNIEIAVYDDITDISYLEKPDGTKTPFVDNKNCVATRTITLESGESEDSDS